jgi:hypothetical protein
LTGDTKLIAPIEPGGDTELQNLARRRSTTGKLLAQLAVRQLLTAARSGTLPDLPPLDPGIFGGLSVWLTESDMTALVKVATDRNVTPKSLASLAVRHLLVQARNGALPMLRPPEPAEPPPERTWEELHARKNLRDAKYLNDPDDLPDEVPRRPARTNFSKAKFIIERMERLAREGIDPSNPRAPLEDIDKLVTVKPA